MLVKFNARGAGDGRGPINYLLGKNRDREKAVVLRGNVEQTKQLIDSLSFTRNYTSGTLSFSEEDIAEHQKKEIMDDFERTIFAGFDSNQYDILWIEHRDKDRLELNFLIPNVELKSGKRLQPYYDHADRTRINAWQQIINDTNNFTDPHAPENKRFNSIDHDLPTDKQSYVSNETNKNKIIDRQQLTKNIAKSLTRLVESGLVGNREDVIEQLKNAGFEIAKETKSSISIKDPLGSKNIRLKGALYERDFEFSEKTRGTIATAINVYKVERGQRIDKFKETYAEAYRRKCEYHEKKYPKAQQGNSIVNIGSFSKERGHTKQRVKENEFRLSHGNDYRSDFRGDINANNTLRNSSITDSDLKNKVDKNDRIRHAVKSCISAISSTIRAAIKRDNRASGSSGRTSDIVNELKIQHFKERKKQRAESIERANELSM